MIIYLGNQRGYPIFTFTHEKETPFTKPSPPYLKIIAAGIKECFPFNDLEIAEYFMTKAGVYDNYTIAELVTIFTNRDGNNVIPVHND